MLPDASDSHASCLSAVFGSLILVVSFEAALDRFQMLLNFGDLRSRFDMKDLQVFCSRPSFEESCSSQMPSGRNIVEKLKLQTNPHQGKLRSA